jgi:mannose-6-phosphate isomerase-like protein (cupin superfamily)
MKGYKGNIEEITIANTNFRQVLFTSQHQQLVVMSIKPKGDIGTEIHEIVDQFLRIEQGNGELILDGEKLEVRDGDAFIVPAGVEHNVVNTSEIEDLKIYTVYSPPHHKDGVVHKTQEQAEADTTDHI